MKDNKPTEKNKVFLTRLRVWFLRRFLKRAKAGPNPSLEKIKKQFETSQFVRYNLIGNRAAWILPLFKGLDVRLTKSGLRINFKAYISLTVFVTALISATTVTLIPLLLFIVFSLPLISSVLFGIGGALFALAFSIIGFYVYPIYRADTLKRALDDELPFAAGYMAILANAGVSPEKIFYSLSDLSIPLAASAEAKDVVRDLNLFGSDMISALEQTSRHTPSEKFREMIEGFISTVHSGGNLASYLRSKSKEYMKLRRINLKKYADTLSMLSEFYVTLLLTGPLFIVIMLVVMAMLGGGSFGLLSPDILLELITYMGIPVGATIFLIILDTISPKW